MNNVNFFFRFFGNLWSNQPDQPHSAVNGDVASGPLFNVDGTPMMCDAFDVMGKPYGDSGSSFSENTGMFE